MKDGGCGLPGPQTQCWRKADGNMSLEELKKGRDESEADGRTAETRKIIVSKDWTQVPAYQKCLSPKCVHTHNKCTYTTTPLCLIVNSTLFSGPSNTTRTVLNEIKSDVHFCFLTTHVLNNQQGVWISFLSFELDFNTTRNKRETTRCEVCV